MSGSQLQVPIGILTTGAGESFRLDPGQLVLKRKERGGGVISPRILDLVGIPGTNANKAWVVEHPIGITAEREK